MSNYRRQTTFNQCDTSVSETINGRIQINHGVEKRCNLILKELTSEWYASKKRGLRPGLCVNEIRECLYVLPGGDTYTDNDILYAVRKLVKMGFLKTFDGEKVGVHTFVSLVHPPNVLQVKFKEKKAA